MERSRKRVVVIVGASIAVAIGAVAVLIVAGSATLGILLAPDEIDVEPLNEVLVDLEVLKPPANHCPESVDSCWASVVVSSGESRDTTSEIIAANAVQAGFSEVESFNGRWTAKRGSWCLRTFEPDELLVYDAVEFPGDAMYVGLDSC